MQLRSSTCELCQAVVGHNWYLSWRSRRSQTINKWQVSSFLFQVWWIVGNSLSRRQRYQQQSCLHIATQQLVMLWQMSQDRLRLSINAFITQGTEMFVVIHCSASTLDSERFYIQCYLFIYVSIYLFCCQHQPCRPMIFYTYRLNLAHQIKFPSATHTPLYLSQLWPCALTSASDH